MGAGGGDFEGAACGVLAADVGEVVVGVVGVGGGVGVAGVGEDGLLAGEEADDVGEGGDGDDFEAVDDGGFGGVGLGEDEAAEAVAARADGERESAPRMGRTEPSRPSSPTRA